MFQRYRLGQSVSVFTIGSVSVFIMRTFQCEHWEHSASLSIMRTVCFSVNNEDSVFQCQ